MSDSYTASWARTQVQKVITKSFCGHSPTCEERPIAKEEEWGILKTTAITWNGWDENAHKVPPPKYWGKENIEVKKGDVLVTKAGPRHRVGVVVHVQSTKPHLMVSGKMIGLRPQQEMVLPRILAAALSMRDPQVFLDHRSTGMAESQVNFNNGVLLATPIALPTIPEQHAITHILDAVDETIRGTEAMIAKLQQVQAGMLHDLFKYGLNENSEIRDPSRHPDHFKDSSLGNIPIKWEVKTLEDITELSAPICYGIVQVREYVPNGVPVLAIRDLNGDYFTDINRTAVVIDQKFVRSRVQFKDILISIKGTIGRIGIVPKHFLGNISRDIARVRPNESVRSGFLFHLLRSPLGQNILELAKVGTTRAELSIAPLRLLNFVFPSLEEQQRIEGVLNTQDQLLATTQNKLRKLNQFKTVLVHDLLTGSIRVPESMIHKYQTETEVQ
jgi:type I restriction enzyme S subunit